LERVTAYIEKAVREAKMHTSWTEQNEPYERGVHEFITGAMNDAVFLSDLEEFVALLLPPGRINSLAQKLLTLTVPGVPDIYQGTELWDLSLVDPDNRRPVDFDLRRRLLDELPLLSPEDILARMEEGLPKLWVTRQALHARREHPELFGPKGAYRPLTAEGTKARHVVAFARGEGAISIAPRLVMRLGGDWSDTTLELPAGRWRNVMTGDELEGGRVRLSDILARFPVGLLLGGEP
jgi:(1->4)-alpha-D-glucan 1-alpha-D-glucosylmutase